MYILKSNWLLGSIKKDFHKVNDGIIQRLFWISWPKSVTTCRKALSHHSRRKSASVQTCSSLLILSWALGRGEFALAEQTQSVQGSGEGESWLKGSIPRQRRACVRHPGDRQARKGKQGQIWHLCWILSLFPGSLGQSWASWICAIMAQIWISPLVLQGLSLE